MDPMITSSSKTAKPRHVWHSVATCLLQEKSHSHGTDEAWDGRISRVIRASIGYNIALSYIEWILVIKPTTCRIRDLPATIQKDLCPSWHLVALYSDNSVTQGPAFFCIFGKKSFMHFIKVWMNVSSVSSGAHYGRNFSTRAGFVVLSHLVELVWQSHIWKQWPTVFLTVFLALSCQSFMWTFPALISVSCSSEPPQAILMYASL